jgi:hypothetical protein
MPVFAEEAGAAERANLKCARDPPEPSDTRLTVIFEKPVFELSVATRACTLFNHVDLNVAPTRCIPGRFGVAIRSADACSSR